MTEVKNGLWEALRLVQSQAPTLPKDATNPHFKSKFTPLDTIVKTVGPLLANNGLVWTAKPSHDDGKPVLRYELVHADTGDAIADAMPLFMGKESSQDLGSAITYARRYALSSVLNLVSDEDVDGSQPATQPAKPFGDSANQDAIGRASAALTKLCKGNEELARAGWGELKGQFGGYMPEAAAFALEWLAETLV